MDSSHHEGITMNITLLRCQNVSKTFQVNQNKIEVLKNISFDICRGENILLFGKSGQGKSVLLSLLCGLDNPSSGRIYYDGVWLGSCKTNQLEIIRRTEIGIIFQNLNLVPSWTALENVQAALEDITPSLKTRHENALALLEEMGLAGRLYNFPNELSMGEQQRVAIARTLIRRPKLILADEPTGDLDKITAEHIVQLLRSYVQKTNASLLVATHGSYPDTNLDRTLILSNGKISLLHENIDDRTVVSPYTKQHLSLLSSNNLPV
jgi:putative ABC transport system ATP-binding protein